MFTLTEEQVINQVDLEVIRKKAIENMEESKRFNQEEDGSYVALVETVANGNWGWKMHIPLSEVFGYELKEEERENVEKATDIRIEIDEFAQRCAELLTEKISLSGTFYFGEHEADNCYCLFYQEQV